VTTAHIFYIPIIFFVGLFVGFYMGKRATEAELETRRRRHKRRQALKEQNTGAGDSEQA
jgi:uncharacterized protein YneF (UPF0154 family)